VTDGSANHLAEGVRCSGFDEASVSLLGGVLFKSHLHNGQRVATE